MAGDDKDIIAQDTSTSTETQKPIETSLEDQAREFLQQDSIRTAPRDDKVKFLEHKGLPADIIERLIDEEASTEPGLKTIHDSTAPSSSSPSSTTTPSTVPSPPTTSPQPPTQTDTPSASLPTFSSPPTREPGDIPPIITYPEFLLKPSKPPPLVTVPRLINATYAIAGFSALTWSCSKYIVQPLLESLTEARHDFSSTTISSLTKLNSKLETSVSHVPYIASAAVRKHTHSHNSHHAHDEYSDSDSETSDPTELFHRDIATQTTPTLSRRGSVASLSDLHYSAPTSSDATSTQITRLTSLHATLTSLSASTNYTDTHATSLRNTIAQFQSQLETMESSYNILKADSSGFVSGYGSSGVYASATGDAAKKVGSNEALRVKQEIRSLKGAFLSTRNFASAGRVAAHGR